MADVAPGRLGDPASSLGSDPRTDPRLRQAVAAVGLDAQAEPAPLPLDSAREDLLAFGAAAEEAFEGLFVAARAGVPEVAGVQRQTLTAPGTEGHEITLYVHRPARSSGPLPGVVHLHGGGMVVLEASDPAFVAWRDMLAATGLVVVGVEFRNGGGRRGAHPYPAGADDCADATRWVHANRERLGISHVVISGESGGGNLTLSTALRAKRDGWISTIAGLYALCPYIHDPRDSATALASMRECNGYFIEEHNLALLAEIYDPEGKHAHEILCWPLHAQPDDLAGLPPTVISVNELDPLRDEGLECYRRLAEAGVSAVGRVVAGTCHATELIFSAALADIQAATIRDISSFAHAVG